MADILFHPEAEAEFQAALAWYWARSLQAGERFEAEVERVLGLIAASPGLFPLYDKKTLAQPYSAGSRIS